jgi:hypothetical protein
MAILLGHACSWEDYKSKTFHPAQMIMQNWVQNIHDLIYLPMLAFELRAQLLPEFDQATGTRKYPSEAELIAFANREDWKKWVPMLKEEYYRNELNNFRAVRNLYHRFGWPDQGQFDRQGLLNACWNFHERVQAYDKQLKISNRQAFWPVEGVVFTPEEMEMRKNKDDYLQEMAGLLRVKRLENRS